MPAIRACGLIHPKTGEPGIWVTLSSGEIRGQAQADWPAWQDPQPDTLEDATARVSAYAQYVVGPEVRVEIPVLSISPLVLGPIRISDG
jgi:hypothetical protein